MIAVELARKTDFGLKFVPKWYQNISAGGKKMSKIFGRN
jgi:hypothetical protein